MQIDMQFNGNDLLRRFERRRDTAQVWLDSEILRSTEPFVPMDQGDLIGSGVRGTVPGSGLIVYNSPYAHYQYMDNRGTADTDVTGQEVSAAFTGHRKIGDAAQDYILDEVLYDLDKREVEFLDFDDSIAAGSPNGWKGRARLQISDFGSGNAADRQSISFTLNYVGKPVRGTVTKDTSGKLTFTPAA